MQLQIALTLVAGSLAGSSDTISLYFGDGCFWGRQYTFTTDFEQKLLGREGVGITSIGGFAGGAGHATHDVCYHNANNTNDYAEQGHAEAVQVHMSPANVTAAAQTYFGSFVPYYQGGFERSDPFDAGPGYRAIIGVPGGFNGPHMGAIRKGNVNNMTLVNSLGSGKDTLGTNTVQILDSTKNLFHQADLCLQFHQAIGDMPYPASYFKLNETLLAAGKLRETKCPVNYVC